MVLLKFLAFLCVASCCAFIYTLVEYKSARKERKHDKMERLVYVGIVSVFTLIITSIPLAYYTLYTF